MWWLRVYLLSTLLLMNTSVLSSERIRVVGLFRDAAIVRFDGKQEMIKKGARGNSGALLLSADPESALIRYQGEEKRIYLQASIGGEYAKPEYARASIEKDDQSHYYIDGSINDQPAGFMVDTGTTSIAMNGDQAKKLGIDYRTKGKEGQAITASGVVRSFQIRLERVKVGDIELERVSAVVLEGEFPVTVLLGMSFLSRVEMSEVNGMLRLKKKY